MKGCDIMSINPINPDYKPNKLMSKFKFFTLTNFPFIEADFDAITDYQLLCKVVEYLNEVRENVNTDTSNVEALYQAFLSLQNEVNLYIDEQMGIINDTLDEQNEKIDNH